MGLDSTSCLGSVLSVEDEADPQALTLAQAVEGQPVQWRWKGEDAAFLLVEAAPVVVLLERVVGAGTPSTGQEALSQRRRSE